MTTVLDRLLALQEQDEVVDGLLARIDLLRPRLAQLDSARDDASRLLAETKMLVQADEQRQRELEGRISDHRQRHERNLTHLDSVKRMREATAAMAQVEAGRKVLADEENELRNLVARVADGHTAIRKQEEALKQLEGEQADARAEIAAEQESLQAELHDAESTRGKLASAVEAALLQKYDRIRRRRRAQAVFALSGSACSACDTAVPVQRRKMMATTGAIEVCEACGVLLYAEI